jgi:tripartite-type tricarboxylate transporter receptor subunit TctC
VSDRLGQPFIIENRPGAGGNIAAEFAVRAPADGYTLLIVGANNFINATLYNGLNFDIVRDIDAVASIVCGPLIMEVSPSFPAKSIAEFVAYAKSNPGKVNMASSGIGSASHVAGELFKMMTGIEMVHVPYRGSPPALTDLLGGQVQVMFDVGPSSIEHVRAGRLRALAVTTATRWEPLPDIPTVGEFVPGYEASALGGVGVPKGTPPEIIEKLNKAVNSCLADPTVKARIAGLGATIVSGSPAEFRNLVATETEKWAKVIKFAGIKAE